MTEEIYSTKLLYFISLLLLIVVVVVVVIYSISYILISCIISVKIYMMTLTVYVVLFGYFLITYLHVFSEIDYCLFGGYRLIIILLQRGRLSPSVPLLHDAPGNHVIRPCFIPDASSVNKEETGNTVSLTSN